MTPYYRPGDPCIDVTTGLGYPKKANDARADPKVGLLFSDPTGSGAENAPQVLVQGIAEVDDRDLDANRERYERESVEKLPATADQLPPKPLRRMFRWYFTRIYVHVRPERVYVWRDGDVAREPELFDAHLEEVRSGHVEEPARRARAHARRLTGLGRAARRAGTALPAGGGLAGFARRLPLLGAGADHRGSGRAPDPAGRRARWAFPGSRASRA